MSGSSSNINSSDQQRGRGGSKTTTSNRPANNANNPTSYSSNNNGGNPAAVSASVLPIGDPFERVMTTPKELLIQRSASPRRASASPLKSAKSPLQRCLDQLPKLTDMSPNLREKLLESKLDQCKYLCEFEAIGPLDGISAYSSTDAISNSAFGNSNSSDSGAAGNFISPLELRNREIKRQTLLELIELVNTSHRPIPDQLYPNFFDMIFVNIFRPLPPPINPTGDAYDPTEDEPILDPSWPHLQLVYELFIRFLESPDLNGPLARKYIDPAFILRLLALFDGEDPRERDLLKTTLHRIYAKFLQLRAFIRKSIHNVFYEFVADPTEYRHNISEMLEILGSIINGFALPLKEEHKIFLEKTLLPLHKTRYLCLYFRQLDYCVVQFVEKDAEQAVPVILGLLRMWPKTNSTKEVMFLTEIEEILDILPVEQFKKLAGPLYRQLARCIDSNHFQVAERALMYWQNDYVITSLLPSCNEEILRAVLPVLSKHSKSHWNRNVQMLVLHALDCFMSIDPVAFDGAVALLPAFQNSSLERRKRLLACWQSLDKNLGDASEEQADARSQLYSQFADLITNNESLSVIPTSHDIASTTVAASNSNANSENKISSSSANPANNNIVGTRRKSILPMDQNVYEELMGYSRSSSPRPEGAEIEEDSQMKD